MSYFGHTQTNAELGVAAFGLVVHDIEASEHFYGDILGLVESGGFSLDEQWSKDAGAANNEPFSVKEYKLQDTATATVLKLAYFEKPVKKLDISSINQQSGVNYITLFFSAQAFNAILKRLDEAGIKKTGWVKRKGYQLFFVKDPNGVFVEVVGPNNP